MVLGRGRFFLEFLFVFGDVDSDGVRINGCSDEFSSVISGAGV